MPIIECDQGDCIHNEDGECTASMVAIISQECMTYEYEGGYEEDEDERDKLREMVCDVHEALHADKAGMFHKLTLASMEDDMRELGIEVDG